MGGKALVIGESLFVIGGRVLVIGARRLVIQGGFRGGKFVIRFDCANASKGMVASAAIKQALVRDKVFIIVIGMDCVHPKATDAVCLWDDGRVRMLTVHAGCGVGIVGRYRGRVRRHGRCG
jgi:hypothetical protein